MSDRPVKLPQDDEVQLRRLMRLLDWAAGGFVGLVAGGLWFETDRIWSAGGAVTFGVLGEFVVHFLHMRAFKCAEAISDEKSRAQQLEVARFAAIASEANARALEAEAKLVPSYLFPERRPALLDRLRPWAGHVAIVFLGMDHRRDVPFAQDVKSALADAGWQVRLEVLEPHSPPDSPAHRYRGTGILVEHDTYEGCDPTVRYAAESLAGALKMYGYEDASSVQRHLSPLAPGEAIGDRRTIRVYPASTLWRREG